jgi:hypothetical protein
MPEALVISDTSYAGTVASYMLTRAVVGADTIEKGAIYVEDGIKKKRTIPRIEVSNFMQRRTATPTSQGTVTVDGKVLEPRDIMLYYEFNPRDYEQHWYAEQLKPKLLDRDLPQTAEAYMVMLQMKRLNEFFEYAIWHSRIQYDPLGDNVDPTSKGDTATVGSFTTQSLFYFDGIIKKLLDDATTIDVAAPITLTAANVRSEIQRGYALVPPALLFKYGPAGLKIIVGYNTQKLYEQALREDTYKNQDTTQKGINQWGGYDIVPCAGVPDNTYLFVIAKPDIDSNLWLGINSTEDNQLQLQRLQNNSELFFLKGLFKMDTQAGFPDQIVMYTTLTA